MKPTTRAFLEKARRAIASARRLHADGDLEAAVARAYYAMFYVAESLLHERGLSFSKHGGVHGAFGQHFAKAGILDEKYHRWLLAAFNKRVIADYGVDATFAGTEALELIEQAEEFLQAGQRHLSS